MFVENGKWYEQVDMDDRLARKWRSHTTRKFGGIVIDSDQMWTKDGYALAVEHKMIDPQLPAVPGSYLKFYGRDEAISRLSLTDDLCS